MVTTTIDLSNLDGNNGFRLDGGPATLSGVSVSNAGDFNGDGFDDLIIGAPWAGLNIYDRSGSCYVVFGKDSGFGATLDLTTLNGTNGFRLDESNEASYLGRTVSNAGRRKAKVRRLIFSLSSRIDWPRP